MSDRALIILFNLASVPMLGGIVWYAHVAQCRLPRERWWKWIALGFVLMFILRWMGFFLQWDLIPRSPWGIVDGALAFLTGAIFFFAIRAVARQAQASNTKLEHLDRTSLDKLKELMGGEHA